MLIQYLSILMWASDIFFLALRNCSETRLLSVCLSVCLDTIWILMESLDLLGPFPNVVFLLSSAGDGPPDLTHTNPVIVPLRLLRKSKLSRPPSNLFPNVPAYSHMFLGLYSRILSLSIPKSPSPGSTNTRDISEQLFKSNNWNCSSVWTWLLHFLFIVFYECLGSFYFFKTLDYIVSLNRMIYFGCCIHCFYSLSVEYFLNIFIFYFNCFI